MILSSLSGQAYLGSIKTETVTATATETVTETETF